MDIFKHFTYLFFSPQLKALLFFAITYGIICGRKMRILKIGRPAGVMLGTVLMILGGIIKPEQTYNLVNWDTIILLFGMMILIEHLAEAEFFQLMAEFIKRKNYNPRQILAIVVFIIGGLAAFLVNDIVCIFFTPLLIILIKEKKLNPLPFLLALATSTNLGGIISLVGNPQNMIIGNLAGINFTRFFFLMLPIGILTLIANYWILIWKYGDELSTEKAEITKDHQIRIKPLLKRSISITILVITGFFLGFNMSWTAFFGATILLLLANRDEISLLKKIDWNLLLFFSGLFVVIGAVQESGATETAINWMNNFISEKSAISFWSFGFFSVIVSNLFANVPYVIIAAQWIQSLGSPELLWFVLSFASTVAGNLTILGAIANIIVVEKAKELCDISFGAFFAFGLPSTIISFIIGMATLWLYHILGFL